MHRLPNEVWGGQFTRTRHWPVQLCLNSFLQPPNPLSSQPYPLLIQLAAADLASNRKWPRGGGGGSAVVGPALE